jgi:hypothetical protein
MLNRPQRTSLTQNEIVVMKKENNQLKLQLKELEEDYKEIQEKYNKDVVKVQQSDEELKVELRNTYEKWSQSKTRVTELLSKLKAVV